MYAFGGLITWRGIFSGISVGCVSTVHIRSNYRQNKVVRWRWHSACVIFLTLYLNLIYYLKVNCKFYSHSRFLRRHIYSYRLSPSTKRFVCHFFHIQPLTFLYYRPLLIASSWNTSDPNERCHFWIPDSPLTSSTELLDTPVTERMYIERDEVVRIRVESDEFYDDEPGPPKLTEGVQVKREPKRAPYTVCVSTTRVACWFATNLPFDFPFYTWSVQ